MIRNRLKNNLAAVALLVISMSVVLTGCKDKTPPPAAPPVKMAEPAKPQAKAVQPQVSSTKAPSAAANQFDFSTKKDPFKPFVAVKAAPAATREKRANALPIHSFDVSQFRLIGIITGDRHNQAMVVDPNGKGYVLKPGMTIGKSEGKIIAITSSGVQILQQFKDDNGRVRKEHVSITLPRKQ